MSFGATSQAKDTLLRALEELEDAESALTVEPDRVDLVVVYSIGKAMGDGAWHEVGGWASTPGPKWMHAAMLRRGAEAFDESAVAIDDEPEDEEQ